MIDTDKMLRLAVSARRCANAMLTAVQFSANNLIRVYDKVYFLKALLDLAAKFSEIFLRDQNWESRQ